ncbi:MAG TPA: glycosyltransferase family 2 protein [candidate division WWE3 bacterium]|uniref:dolichyl-phosphate beta-glucosyltransferase n=1 Tax=candidate division WWE3 bacterium TaxID=2053526 RepID=A0A7V5J1Q2_UNCKA|nr:glycosyltransferase family 2 protein [candidate division WWE3 bacterium]
METQKKVSLSSPFISIVIPAYNEEKNILNTLKTIEDFLSQQDYTYEVLVMNDGSLDSTSSIANNYAKTNKHITVYDLPHKGKANAVLEGFKKARGEYVLFSDADLATPINELKKLLHYAVDENYDVVIASREGVGALRKNEPWIRHFMGRVFNLIVQFMLIPGLDDTQCGFKLFKREEALKIIQKMKLYNEAKELTVPKVTAFDVEMLFLARKLKLKIKPVSVEWHYGEDTKVNNLRDSVNNFLEVLKVWWNNKKGLYK